MSSWNTRLPPLLMDESYRGPLTTTPDAITAPCALAIVGRIEQRCVANRAGSPCSAAAANRKYIAGIDSMKNIASFGVFALLVLAFGLSGACVSQGDPAGEAPSKRIATEGAPTVAAQAPAMDPASSAMTLPAGENSSLQPDSLQPPCSICSDFSCQTRSFGAPCSLSNGAPGNMNGTCEQFSDRTCHTDGLMTCRCGAVP